jgi:hypothetical protein
MHRLIKGIAVVICLQWSLPAWAASVTCEISHKLASPLIPNEVLATELTAAESYFRVKCSCLEGGTLMNNNSKVKLSIVQDQSNVYSGLAGIRLAGSSDDFGVETTAEDYQVSSSSSEQMYAYLVKVSAPNGEFLQAKNYTVAVKIDLFSPPLCKTDEIVAPP